MSDGMTRIECAQIMSQPENAHRTAVYAKQTSDGKYAVEWEGRTISGGNPFQLDSYLDQAGVPAPRNLFLLKEGEPDD